MNKIICNIQHLKSPMAGSRKLCKNKNYFNHNSMNGLLIVYTMALMSPLHSSTFETDLDRISCSNAMTCTTCTIEPLCVWSLEHQACENNVNQEFNSSSLIVTIIEECPKFSVDKKYHYDDYGYNFHVEYIVEITNDLVGFINYLNNCTIYYGVQVVSEEPVKTIINETKMFCLFNRNKLSHMDTELPPDTFFVFIKFNDTMLRFDNVADHYFTFYNHEKCAANEMFKSCATCGWNNDDFTNYLKWCSSDTTCQVTKDVYLKNSANVQFSNTYARVTNECAEINVTAVNPLLGPETGGTTLTITVRNHRIFAENHKIRVLVAGTVCANPRTSGPETITCTTSLQSKNKMSGKILVQYKSIEFRIPQKRELGIESSQIFQFCPEPVLDADQLLGGITSGGTAVPVRGNHFVEPCFPFLIRLYIELVDGVIWYADSYCDQPVNDTYMVCRSPSLNGTGWDGDDSIVGRLLNFGLQMTFSKDDSSLNQSLAIKVRGPSLRFYVHPDPVVLDFEIDEGGLVVVNGLNLQHVQPEDIEIRSLDSPSSFCVVMWVTRHSLMCEPTVSITESQVISVKFGNSLVFTVIGRTSPHPDESSSVPSWFLVIIAMFTVLVLVCALACCLRIKHRYNVTENIHNLPVVSTRLDDL